MDEKCKWCMLFGKFMARCGIEVYDIILRVRIKNPGGQLR